MLILAMALVAVFTAQSAPAESWAERSHQLRHEMRDVLTLPAEPVPLDAVTRRRIAGEEYTIESVTYASEPASRVTALLYLPADRRGRVPAVVLACGHGGSKSCLYAQYAGQLYAKLGFACFVPDTIGEEEREATGRMGARGHDLRHLGDENPVFVRTKLKRMVLGKIVWDLIRGIDYLESRVEVDAKRVGIMGYSLGGASAGCAAILDARIDAAVLCGWVFRQRYATWSKYCTRMPYAEFDRRMRFDEMTALLAPHAATLFMCGERDSVIDHDEGGAAAVRDLRTNIEGARRILAAAGIEGTIEAHVVPGADHRPFFLSREGVTWMQHHLMEVADRRALPDRTIRFGDWVDGQGQRIEKLYATEARERGLEAVDVGAIYRDPRDLACFPERQVPSPEYTMKGWIETVIKGGPPGGE